MPFFANGNVRSPERNLISAKGNVSSPKGNLVSAEGNVSSPKGNLVSAQGNTLSPDRFKRQSSGPRTNGGRVGIGFPLKSFDFRYLEFCNGLKSIFHFFQLRDFSRFKKKGLKTSEIYFRCTWTLTKFNIFLGRCFMSVSPP